MEWNDAAKRALVDRKRAAAATTEQLVRGDAGMRSRVATLEVSRERFPQEADAKRRAHTLDFRTDRPEHTSENWRFAQQALAGKSQRIVIDPGVVAVVVPDGTYTFAEWLTDAT